MAAPEDQEILSISQLNREARKLLESGLARVWVAGEISNIARPASGHVYFSLKDQKAQVRCAMWRTSVRRLGFDADNGQQVLARAKVSIYEPRGDYQLIIETLEEAGEGLLRRQFEELKKKLAAEGLFDEQHKQELPELPLRIGVITSPSGAAIRDILHILARRLPAAEVIIYPVAVQGAAACEQVATALRTAEQRGECDVLIVGRGGGSLEDLWTFNEEAVARAIFNCPIPVISAVGHEVDFTISDLVADVRAPTPSGAAELAVPDRAELLARIRTQQQGILRMISHLLGGIKSELRHFGARLQQGHPGAVLNQLAQRQDELNRRLVAAVHDQLAERARDFERTTARFLRQAPAANIREHLHSLRAAIVRLKNAMREQLDASQHRFSVAAAMLNTVSPLATLERGYAIVRKVDNDAIVRSATQLNVGDRIRARLGKGEIEARVEKK
ncbi:MAG: exodeoxyribonuclease VII large subunit [Gammaproteobacteria bacterium]